MRYFATTIGGGTHEPVPGGRIDGAFGSGQYIRIIAMNSPWESAASLPVLAGRLVLEMQGERAVGVECGLSRMLSKMDEIGGFAE